MTKAAKKRTGVGGPVDNPVVARFIEAAGRLTQSFGMGRILGQIYGAAYFSRTPLSLDDFTSALGISKGSASMNVRQLEQWGALSRIWVKGDRKDYYRATDKFGKIVRKAILDSVGEQMQAGSAFLEEAMSELAESGRASDTDAAFIRRRLKKIVAFQSRAKGLWESSILKMLLK